MQAQTVAPPKTHLKVGDEAPDFSVPTTQGKTFKLSDHKGKHGVVVAFSPLRSPVVEQKKWLGTRLVSKSFGIWDFR